jgi:hypothetical protein
MGQCPLFLTLGLSVIKQILEPNCSENTVCVIAKAKIRKNTFITLKMRDRRLGGTNFSQSFTSSVTTMVFWVLYSVVQFELQIKLRRNVLPPSSGQGRMQQVLPKC